MWADRRCTSGAARASPGPSTSAKWSCSARWRASPPSLSLSPRLQHGGSADNKATFDHSASPQYKIRSVLVLSEDPDAVEDARAALNGTLNVMWVEYDRSRFEEAAGARWGARRATL